MRKTMIFAAVAALISFASCQKEGLIESGGSKNASPVFTASIAGATKITVNVTDGKIAWEADDEITVADASAQSAVYVVESIDATTGKATFAMKDGETALGEGPYTATYGAEPATAQTYSATAGKLYMTAPETSNNSFTFTVQCGLMKLNLTKAGESVKSISVTGTPEGGSETTYTLTCTEAQSIAAEKDFFIALPEGTYTKIVITNSSNKVCTLNSAAGVAVAANHIKPVTFGETKINFVPALPAGALPGVFSVSATKKVYFSKGNLQATCGSRGSRDYSWRFAENQYDYIGNAPGNTTIDSLTAGGVVDLFGWSTSTTYYGIRTETAAGTYKGGFVDWGRTIGDGMTWRTLSKDEWSYLFSTRSVNGGTGAGKSYSLKITYGGSTGAVLYPDDYTGQPLSGTVETLPKGVVFLPAAGQRQGDKVTIGSGFYWSSTWGSRSQAQNAFYMSFGGSKISSTESPRYFGYSVRLVTDSNQ